MVMKSNSDEFQQYEYARKRVASKKNVYYHFITMLLGIAFMYIVNNWLNILPQYKWWIWLTILWIFIFLIHFIQVFITHKFMGKAWEQNQIEKLVKKQQEKIEQLKKQIPNE